MKHVTNDTYIPESRHILYTNRENFYIEDIADTISILGTFYIYVCAQNRVFFSISLTNIAVRNISTKV